MRRNLELLRLQLAIYDDDFSCNYHYYSFFLNISDRVEFFTYSVRFEQGLCQMTVCSVNVQGCA